MHVLKRPNSTETASSQPDSGVIWPGRVRTFILLYFLICPDNADCVGPAASSRGVPRLPGPLSRGGGTLGARREEEGRVRPDDKAGRVDIEIMLKVIIYVYNIKLVLRHRSFMHIPKAWKGEN